MPTLKPFEVKTYLSEILGNTTTSKTKRKKEKKSSSRGHCKLQKMSHRNFYNNCSERFKEIPCKTSVVVYFT